MQDANLQEMALELTKLYDISDFKALNGYIHKFKARHNISSRSINGEANLVDNDVIDYLKEIYKKKLECYESKNVLNCDETG